MITQCLLLIWGTWLANVVIAELLSGEGRTAVTVTGDIWLCGGLFFSALLTCATIKDTPVTLWTDGMKIASIPYLCGTVLTAINVIVYTNWTRLLQLIGRLY